MLKDVVNGGSSDLGVGRERFAPPLSQSKRDPGGCFLQKKQGIFSGG